MLLIGIVVPLGILFLAIIYKIILKIFTPKLTKEYTFMKIKLENNSIEGLEFSDNLSYRYHIENYFNQNKEQIGNAVYLVVFFLKNIETSSIRLEPIGCKKPTYSGLYYGSNGSFIKIDNMEDGEYIISFNKKKG